MNAKPQEIVPHDNGQVVAADAGTIMTVIARAASDPTVNVEKLERLTALYERIKAGEAKAAYAAALATMQAELPVVAKRGSIDIGRGNPQKYALWQDINEEIKPVLEQHGFSLSFRVGSVDGKPSVTGILQHRGGHAEETTMVLPIDASGSKNAVQAIGSSTSYGKRYVAGALLNLTFRDEADDDGKAAGIGETVSEEQIAELQRLIMDADANLPKFLKVLNVEKIDDLPAARYADAVDALNILKAKREARKG